MGRSAYDSDGLREAPRSPGLGPPSEDADPGPHGDRGAAAAPKDIAPPAWPGREDFAARSARHHGPGLAESPRDPGSRRGRPVQPHAVAPISDDEIAELFGLGSAGAAHAAAPAAPAGAASDRPGPGSVPHPDAADVLPAPSHDPGPTAAAHPPRAAASAPPGPDAAPTPPDDLFAALDPLPAVAGEGPQAALLPANLPSDRDLLAEHRARLRGRFLRAGPDSVEDYEMLELILFRAIPRRDVKPIAKRLLKAFGDFNHVISAPPRRLAEITGMGEAAITELKIVEAAAHRLAQSRVLHRDAIQSWDQLTDYLRQRLAHEDTEQFRVLFLDRRNVLIADEAQARGTVDHVPVYPREVVRRALDLGASALVLVHNHPSGDPTPSRADVDMTRRVMEACRTIGVTLHDHVVVGRGGVASFHALGLLDE